MSVCLSVASICFWASVVSSFFVCATSGASRRDRLLRDTCFATLASDTCFATVASPSCFATLASDTCFATARHLLRDTCFATLARNRHLQLIIPPASIPVGYKKKTLRSSSTMGHLWLLLLFACASPAAVLGAIDERFVAQAASAGMSTSDIALQLGCTQRRIQQILAFLRPPSAAGPSPRSRRRWQPRCPP